ncbi:MAG: hypothetical protein IAF02_15925, partial [Anaerolineae bacterium]|nr:hypothetical protein [Anaerolineae bacterium]
MAGNDRIDFGMERIVNRDDWPGDADAGIHITRRWCLRATFVQEHDDGLDTLTPQDWDEFVGSFGLVEKVVSLNASSR